MHARDLITADIPPLRPQDEVGRALDWMEEFKVAHLPVVEDQRLVGLVKDMDLVDLNDPRGTVNDVMERVALPFARGGQHIYEVMKLFSERGLTVVPVLDDMGLYLGSLSRSTKRLHRLAEITNLHETGSSVVLLEMNARSTTACMQIARHRGGQRWQGAQRVQPHSLPDSRARMEVTLKSEPRGDQRHPAFVRALRVLREVHLPGLPAPRGPARPVRRADALHQSLRACSGSLQMCSPASFPPMLRRKLFP
jgi:acetoin utilization protein AcuB